MEMMTIQTYLCYNVSRESQCPRHSDLNYVHSGCYHPADHAHKHNQLSRCVYHSSTIASTHTKPAFETSPLALSEKGQKDQRSNTVHARSAHIWFFSSSGSRKPTWQSPVIEERHIDSVWWGDWRNCSFQSDCWYTLEKIPVRGTRKGQLKLSVCVCTVQSLAYKTSSQQNIYQWYYSQ